MGDFVGRGYALHDDTDHVYTRLVGFEHGVDKLPTPADFLTDSEPTDSRSIAELVQAIANTTHWDIQAELDVQAPHFAEEDCDDESAERSGPSPA